MSRALAHASMRAALLIAAVGFFGPAGLASAGLPKVGAPFAFDSVDDMRAMQQISWWYNWATAPAPAAQGFGSANGIEYVPMQWGSGLIDQLINSPGLQGAKALLGFNEPNHRNQANIDPVAAAQLWPRLEEAARKFGLRLGSPSPVPCGPDECTVTNPFDWWDQFFAACVGCKVDFLAIHTYMCDAAALAGFLQQCRKYAKPMWVTELSCPAGPGAHEDQQTAFMQGALALMDAAPDVERYAWFAPRVSDQWVGESAALLQPGAPLLNPLGALYLHPRGVSRGVVLGGSPGRVKAGVAKGGSWTSLCSDCLKKGAKPCGGKGPPSKSCVHCSLTCGVKTPWHADRRKH